MSSPLVPVIIVGGAVYVLAGQAPAGLPPVGTGQAPASSSNVPPPYRPMGPASQAQPGDSAKIDAAMAAMAAKYENQLTDQEKQQAAQQLNSSLNLDPPLNGNETWAQVASVVGGAVGGVYGGPVGAMVGAYLGTTL